MNADPLVQHSRCLIEQPLSLERLPKALARGRRPGVKIVPFAKRTDGVIQLALRLQNRSTCDPCIAVTWGCRNGAIGLASVLGVVLGIMLVRRLRPARAPAPSAPAARTDGQVDAAIAELTAAARQDPAMIARLLAEMMGTG